MTPGARVAAAIEILDTIIAGEATEAALTRWARGSRFAGSKDRAAVRDHVFDGVRNLRSYACAGGASGVAPNGRAVMVGAARAQLSDISEWFSGQGYAPSVVLEGEVGIAPETQADRWNVPDWLCDEISASLGNGADAYAALSGQRAPITLRVNVAKTSVADAQARLLKDGIACEPNPAAQHALSVMSGARAVRNSGALHDGWIELQDAHSQAVIEDVPLAGVQTALDFCAGGGGKSLALAARGVADVHAHDVDPKRMSDISMRADRAGAKVTLKSEEDLQSGAYDLVLIDAPCSGSGSWRRAPDGKWRLTPDRLEELTQIQQDILRNAQRFVAPGGLLVYVTCSVLHQENGAQVDQFVQENDWREVSRKQWPVAETGDGFFAAHLKRA